MKNNLERLSYIVAILLAEAWFLWNPDGWTFEWEPLSVFVLAFIALITAEIRHYKQNTSKTVNEHDKELYENLKALFSPNFLLFIETHDFGGPFEREDVEPLKTFYKKFDSSHHKFLYEPLEEARIKLMDSAEKFNEALVKYTSPNKHNFLSVKPEHFDDTEESWRRIKKETEILNDSASQFFDQIEQFFNLARNHVHGK